MKKPYDATIEATAATLVDATLQGILEVPCTEDEWHEAIEMAYEVTIDGDLGLQEIPLSGFDLVTIRAAAERIAKTILN